MAFVMRMEWPEVTPELYDKVREIVDWEQSVVGLAVVVAALVYHQSSSLPPCSARIGTRTVGDSEAPGWVCK